MEKTSLSLRCPSVRLNLDTRLVQRELFHLVKLKNSKLPGFVPWFHLAVVGVGMLFMSHVCTKKYQNPKIRFIWISMIIWSCWYMYGYFTETCSLHVCRATITGQFILDGIYIYIYLEHAGTCARHNCTWPTLPHWSTLQRILLNRVEACKNQQHHHWQTLWPLGYCYLHPPKHTW